jgi:hypothetical protein
MLSTSLNHFEKYGLVCDLMTWCDERQDHYDRFPVMYAALELVFNECRTRDGDIWLA